MLILTGDPFLADTDALINPTTCTQNKASRHLLPSHPGNKDYFANVCGTTSLRVGDVVVFDHGYDYRPRYVLNTVLIGSKNELTPADAYYLLNLCYTNAAKKAAELEIRSIAVFKLYFESSDKNWVVVRKIIVDAFAKYPQITVHLYPGYKCHNLITNNTKY